MNDDAAALRAVYADWRSRYESDRMGGPVEYRVPAHYDGRLPVVTDDGAVLDKGRAGVWANLAAKLAASGLPAEEYVACQFRSLDPSEQPPEPAQLLSGRCQARYAKWRQSRPELVRSVLASQRDLAGRETAYRRGYGWDTRTAVLAVASDPSVNLCPLFRYCLLVQAGGPAAVSLARRLRPAAVDQYRRDRDYYDREWVSVLPQGFGQGV